MHAVAQLKQLEYPKDWPGHGVAKLAYAIFPDGRIVFSGLDQIGTAGVASSINITEELIAVICEKEGIDPARYRFFDLQTHRMYGMMGDRYQPGEFKFDEIYFDVVNGKIVNVSWDVYQRCPNDVRELFAEIIGPDPYNLLDHMDRRAFHRR